MIRERVSMLERDRELTPDIEALDELIASGALLGAVESALS